MLYKYLNSHDLPLLIQLKTTVQPSFQIYQEIEELEQYQIIFTKTVEEITK